MIKADAVQLLRKLENNLSTTSRRGCILLKDLPPNAHGEMRFAMAQHVSPIDHILNQQVRPLLALPYRGTNKAEIEEGLELAAELMESLLELCEAMSS